MVSLKNKKVSNCCGAGTEYSDHYYDNYQGENICDKCKMPCTLIASGIVSKRIEEVRKEAIIECLLEVLKEEYAVRKSRTIGSSVERILSIKDVGKRIANRVLKRVS